MSEPTKEQIEEATPLLLGHSVECPDGMVMSAVGLAHIIAKVRAKATNDALEQAILFGLEYVDNEDAFTFADAIRAMKVPT